MVWASDTQRDWGRGWRSGNLLAILLILIFAGSLFVLGPARAQTGDTNEDLAAGPAAEASAAAVQAAYETRLTALFDQARRTGKVRVIVQLRMPFRSEAVLDRAQESEQQAAIAAQQSAVVERLTQRFGLDERAITRFETIPYFALAVDAAQLDALRTDPEVAAIEEDALFSPMLYQSVPLIRANVAHTQGYTGAGQVVAVLDTGVLKDHPFLMGQVVAEACYSGGGGLQSLCPGGVAASTASGAARNCPPFIKGCGHGTHVAGIVAGKKGVKGTMSGVAPGAKIIAIQVFSLSNTDCKGTPCVTIPSLVGASSSVILGLERVWALRNTHKIAAVNLSLGGYRHSDTATCDRAYSGVKAVIDRLRTVGIATVVASGNSGWSDSLGAPACISTAISIGATTKADQVPSYSNSAPFLKLLAPGGDGPLPSSTTRIFSSGVIASAVSAGGGHTCGVRSDGTVACRGLNLYGQVTPPSGVFRQVSAGGYHTCGVRSDGTVACWGAGTTNSGVEHHFGQSRPPSGAFTQVSAGFDHTCGVRSNGTVACWGAGTTDSGVVPHFGQAIPPAGAFTQVSAGFAHTCGVRSDGAVACWGAKKPPFNFGQSIPPSGVFTQVSASMFLHTCGVRSDGAVACWGYKPDGAATPPAGAFTQVSAGAGHTCGVRSDGAVACWGSKEAGATTPPVGTFTQVSAGAARTCGVRSDGAVACWGDNLVPLPADPWAGFQFLAGTSMAAPHVAGAWAVLKSKKPNASVLDIWYVLHFTGKPIKDNRNGLTLPRIDVAAALNALTLRSLRINDVSKAEGNAGVTAFTFTVTLSPASPGPVTVKYATANGTALAGSDYTATSGTLTFTPGQTRKTVTVNVIGDAVKESNEVFAINLSAPTGATLFDARGVGTILNDD